MRRFRPILLLAVVASLAATSSASAANPVPPTATTGAASAATQTTATVSGAVNPQGAATSVVFQYGTSSAYGLTTPAQDAGTGTSPVAVQTNLTGLTANTTYHYRVVATNAAGVAPGADRTFTTARTLVAPSVTTGAAAAITTGGATLTASVDAGGLATTVVAQYGTSTKYGATTAAVPLAAGFGGHKVNLPVAGLASYTTYHYRVVATNAKGVTRGADRTLKTLRAPAQVTFTSVPTAIGWGGSATLSGQVTGAGVGGIGLAVAQVGFPFTAAATTKSFSASSSGAFRVTTGPLFTATQLRVFTRTTVSASSPTITVLNRLKVSVRVINQGRRTVRLTGTAQPASPAGNVIVQRLSRSGQSWVRVAKVGLKPRNAFASKYSVRVLRPRAGGEYRVVASARDGGAHARGTTATVHVSKRR